MKKIISVAVFLMASIVMMGQVDASQNWQVNTKDGNQFIGQIVEDAADSIQLETKAFGIIGIARHNIKSIRLLQLSKDGNLWPQNHHSSRYFFGPTGFGLKKGEGYYQNNWVLLNQVSYGITDHFSLGAGVVPFFLFGGYTLGPLWITPKLSYEYKDVGLGGGALIGIVPGEDVDAFGVVYGSTTFGDRDKNLTLGAGYFFSGDDFSNSPTVSLSLMFRVTRKFYFISENYFLGSGNTSIVSLGGRTVWTNTALDYGLAFFPGSGAGFFALPWLGLTVPLGKRSDY